MNGEKSSGCIKCEFCDSTFVNKSLLRNHRNYHHMKGDTKHYSCNKCEFVGDSKDKIVQHVNQVHLNLRPFKCSICKSDYKRKEHLKIHLEDIHGNQTVKKFMCDKCNYKCNRGDQFKTTLMQYI